MNFFRAKIEAYAEIDRLLAKDTPLDLIVYKINTAYGFEKMFVTKRLEKLRLAREAINILNEKEKKDLRV